MRTGIFQWGLFVCVLGEKGVQNINRLTVVEQ